MRVLFCFYFNTFRGFFKGYYYLFVKKGPLVKGGWIF